MVPIIDVKNVQQKDLIALLSSKNIRNIDHKYVYTVAEKKCSLVFSAQLEAAVRDGDICDVLFGTDSILLRINQGIDVSVDLHELDISGAIEQNKTKKVKPLPKQKQKQKLQQEQQKQQQQQQQPEQEQQPPQFYEGEGPRQDGHSPNDTDETVTECERSNHMPNENHMTDMCNEKEHEHISNGIPDINNSEEGVVDSLNEIKPQKSQLHTDAIECIDMIRPVIESWNRDNYSDEVAQINYNLRVAKLPTPYKINAQIIEPPDCPVSNDVLTETIGFEITPQIEPLQCDADRPEQIQKFYETIQSIGHEQLDQLSSTFASILADPEKNVIIPLQSDVIKILDSFSNGVVTDDGLLINIGTDEAPRHILLPGCLAETTNGPEFVCGRTINRENQLHFQPGITVQTDNGISFIPAALILNDSDKPSTLLAGTFCGEQFIGGQTMSSNNATKFIRGETIATVDGLKFIPGLHNPDTGTFVCGQVLTMPDGKETFVPGQMQCVGDDHTEQFFPGQSVYSAEDKQWTFVHGENINGNFVAGKSVICREGSKFVPGSYVDNVFVPGICNENDDGELSFVCGLNVDTKNGQKFVIGQVVNTDDNGEIFLPGPTNVDENGFVSFSAATTIDDIQFMTPTPNGVVVDPDSSIVSTATSSIFGQLIQTSDGIEFQSNKANQSQANDAKIIAGRMIRHNSGTKFVPGIMRDDVFIPGQLIWTEEGEKFVEGQIIETVHGLKFVPGKVSVYFLSSFPFKRSSCTNFFI